MDSSLAISLLKAHKEELTSRFGVRALALFGSVSRNTASAASDIIFWLTLTAPRPLHAITAYSFF